MSAQKQPFIAEGPQIGLPGNSGQLLKSILILRKQNTTKTVIFPHLQNAEMFEKKQ